MNRLKWGMVITGLTVVALLGRYLWSAGCKVRPITRTQGVQSQDGMAGPQDTNRRAQLKPRRHAEDLRRALRDFYFPEGLLPYGEWSSLRPYGRLWNTEGRISKYFEGSNSTPRDYVGPKACRECHKEKFENWMEHAHRKMNALASESSILGDFSGDSTLDYLGGRMHFYREGEKYLISLERDEKKLIYVVTQTIGSRFLQSYVGKLLAGDGQEHLFSRDHVLPAMWRLAKNEWVPWSPSTANTEDGQLYDFYSNRSFREYSSKCSICHVTLPLGNWFARAPRAEQFVPRRLEFDEVSYIRDFHSQVLNGTGIGSGILQADRKSTHEILAQQEASTVAADLGITCEACHHGCREHVARPEQRPRFAPVGRYFESNEPESVEAFGRTVQNLNWTCGRCHRAPPDSQYAWGMSTINSSEFVDAHRGGCYSELTCVHCHDPHKTTGLNYRNSPIQNDELCISCHFNFSESEAYRAHSHHPISSEGSRCMNCHMPRITEGFEDIIRTHAIHSPNDPEFFESNEPNACNLCHLDKSARWTMDWLGRWYGSQFSKLAEKRAAESGDEYASISWLKSDNIRVRQIAGWTLADSKAPWALPYTVDAMNDSNFYVRQYTETALERSTGIDFKQFGYSYWQTPEARKVPLQRIRAYLFPGEFNSP